MKDESEEEWNQRYVRHSFRAAAWMNRTRLLRTAPFLTHPSSLIPSLPSPSQYQQLVDELLDRTDHSGIASIIG